MQLPQLAHTSQDSGKDLPQRQTVLQLDVLHPKDVFVSLTALQKFHSLSSIVLKQTQICCRPIF